MKIFMKENTLECVQQCIFKGRMTMLTRYSKTLKHYSPKILFVKIMTVKLEK